MNSLSFVSSEIVLNQINESTQHNGQTVVAVDSEAYIPSPEVKVPTREQHALANQALAAQREIMYVVENLCNKLDNAEVYA